MAARQQVTCPSCGHKFAASTLVQGAYDAYLAIIVNGSSNVSYSRSSGLAPATVTLYRRLGVALADVRVEADSPLFHFLSARAGASKADVGAAIEAPGATPESVEQVARKYMQ